MNEPLLSVVIPCYNYEESIVQCLRSVFSQRIDFPIELIIGDDCSTDNTREIILETVKENTDPLKTIRLLFHEKNLGPSHFPGKNNWLACLKEVKGKYISICDGDDYWTDDEKLDKQVSYLENTPECSGVFHPADWLIEETGQMIKSRYKPKFKREQYSLVEMLQENGNPIPPGSLVYRNPGEAPPQWYRDVDFGDWALHYINLSKGPYGYFDQPMSVYREHAQGWHSKESDYNNLKKKMHFYSKANEALALSDLPEFRRVYFEVNSELYKLSRKEDNESSKMYFRNMFEFANFNSDKSDLLKTLFPKLWEGIRQTQYYFRRVRQLVIKGK